MTKRIEYIDIAKGIGIILVVWGHTLGGWRQLYIGTFHMPLFFFLSGLCLTKKSNRLAFYKTKVISLIMPLVLWSIIGLILSITGVLQWYSIDRLIEFKYPPALWFLSTLFFVSILYYTLQSHKTCIYIITILSLFVSYMLNKLNVHFPFNLESIPIGFFYFSLGQLFRNYILSTQFPHLNACKSYIYILSNLLFYPHLSFLQ